jgi:hypothetical protein
VLEFWPKLLSVAANSKAIARIAISIVLVEITFIACASLQSQDICPQAKPPAIFVSSPNGSVRHLLTAKPSLPVAARCLFSQ